MTKALIVYSTRNGETGKIAEIIGEGLRFSLVDVELKNAKDFTKPEQLQGYDAYVFGSSTYHGEMMTPMKSFLFLVEQAQLQGKAGGSFGSYGWSGEAAERIYETMLNIYQMDMVNSPLMLKTISVEGGLKMAQDYGKEIGQKLTA